MLVWSAAGFDYHCGADVPMPMRVTVVLVCNISHISPHHTITPPLADFSASQLSVAGSFVCVCVFACGVSVAFQTLSGRITA